MLKNIKIKNFGSIGEEQEMSLEITPKDILDDSAIPIEKENGLNLVSCVIGSNASGKTTLLKAISFLFWFIQNSYTKQKIEDSILIRSHKLKENEPTTIEVEFINKNNFYKYSIEFTKKQILKESLSKKNKRMCNIFELNRQKENANIRTFGFKINKTDEARFKERRNVSLLSSLIDTGYLSDISFFKTFKSNTDQFGRMNRDPIIRSASASYAIDRSESLSKDILSFSKSINLGISGLSFKEMKGIMIRGKNNIEVEKKSKILQCIHSSKKAHFEVPIFEESHGTQHAFFMLSEIYQILETGGLVVIDELESGLHPYVAQKIVSLFENKETNPHNAQIIFSTHQHLLLNDRTKTQIFITERDSTTFETEVYRLDDVEGVRNDENYFHKYIAGTYGGTPKINWL